MSTRIEVTPEMVRRARVKYLDLAKGGRANANDYAHMMLEAALNPPPVLCKNCRKPKNEHKPICDSRFTDGDRYGCAAICPGYVWESTT